MTTSEITSAHVDKARALLVNFNAAVLKGDPGVAHDAHMAYDALVRFLNGDTNFASYADENSPGVFLQQKLRAEPGDTPMWGQQGDFLIVVDDIPAYVEYDPNFHLHGMSYHAVRQSPFISETGFQHEILSDRPAKAYAGKTVREIAIERFHELKEKKKKKLPYPSNWNDKYAALPHVVAVLGEPITKISKGDHVLIKATCQIGVVLGRQWRSSPFNTVATLDIRRATPRIVKENYEEKELAPLGTFELARLDHPGKYLTLDTVIAMSAIKTADNAV
jgi:hypothetical protein